jgi:UDP-glucuronate 4-epimerase
MAIHAFTAAISQGREIPMFGDGTTERDYTYVSDIVQGVLAAIDHDEPYAVYNLGESRTIPLKKLIDLIGELVGKTPRIKAMPEQPGDVKQTCASIDLARARLGYDPKVPIEAGLRNFVAWYQSRA